MTLTKREIRDRQRGVVKEDAGSWNAKPRTFFVNGNRRIEEWVMIPIEYGMAEVEVPIGPA